MDLSALGGVVVKSVASFEWQGNPAPRLHALSGGMINAVGLQGRGVEHWIANDLPRLRACGARVVVSIWGFRESEYEAAALALINVATNITAVEVNLSCPNVEHARSMFAHDAVQSSRVVSVVRRALPNVPIWAKLSPNTDRVVDVARAVRDAGAEAVTLVNTLLGMVLDRDTGRPVLGAGGGGYSGAPLHAVAVRTVFDVHAALPDLPIVGAGGVGTAWDAAELLLAGASAVQVGTATFADPAAPIRVQRALLRWCTQRGVSPAALSGLAHRGGLPPSR